jgi:hypothetical protein
MAHAAHDISGSKTLGADKATFLMNAYSAKSVLTPTREL